MASGPHVSKSMRDSVKKAFSAQRSKKYGSYFVVNDLLLVEFLNNSFMPMY